MEDRFTVLRTEYETEGLRRAALDPNPVRQFSAWFDEAVGAGVPQANAMVLATADLAGAPSARAVLLKDFDDRGFVFYTNLESRKGVELHANPQAALCFVWLPLHRQIRIEGRVEVVADAEADEYFRTRPHGAQIASTVSAQSRPVRDRAELEDRYAETAEMYPELPVPRPPHWSGFRVVPQAFEFWQGREFRLHDRFQYERRGGVWTITRLAP